VDYAFKRLLGTPGHEPLLINLLNAVLRETIPAPLTTVVLPNPFDAKETEDDKLAILDVKARDDDGRVYNIEMQMRPEAEYPAWALYYWAGLFREQLHAGEYYDTLQPAISIHIMDWLMFRDFEEYHLDFQIRNRVHPDKVFSPLLQMHVIQLPRCPMAPESLNNDLARWCYLLRQGPDLDPKELPTKLNADSIHKAMEILAMMVQNPGNANSTKAASSSRWITAKV